MADEIVAFDKPTAQRVLKATRGYESMGLAPDQTRNKPNFSIVQVVVPRSGPDGSGFYTGDLFTYDASTDTFTAVSTNVLIKPLPSTL